ncbi:hypothetical protein RB195_003112 [Necator americanus]|uniref:Uncharacterized protein n=1 Tax=Necator americanus TaxID=51031 RepID=A0ABR1DM32_NECAM
MFYDDNVFTFVDSERFKPRDTCKLAGKLTEAYTTNLGLPSQKDPRFKEGRTLSYYTVFTVKKASFKHKSVCFPDVHDDH